MKPGNTTWHLALIVTYTSSHFVIGDNDDLPVLEVDVAEDIQLVCRIHLNHPSVNQMTSRKKAVGKARQPSGQYSYMVFCLLEAALAFFRGIHAI